MVTFRIGMTVSAKMPPTTTAFFAGLALVLKRKLLSDTDGGTYASVCGINVILHLEDIAGAPAPIVQRFFADDWDRVFGGVVLLVSRGRGPTQKDGNGVGRRDHHEISRHARQYPP